MRENKIFVCIIILILCLLISPTSASLRPSYIPEKNITVSLNAGDTYAHSIITDKTNLTEGQKKLSSDLLMQTSTSVVRSQIQDSLQSSLQIKTIETRSGSDGTVPQNLPSGKLVYVYVYVKPQYPTHIIDSYAYEVMNRDENYHYAAAWVDIQNLETLASDEGVRFIREVIPPTVNTGSVTTEGDIVHHTANVRSSPYNARGAGMKVGIISNGVDNLALSVASGDLPADVTVLSNTLGGDEGTAMLEIVHDMAPDAKLYFHDPGSNTIAFNAAIDALIANGCKVICDDINWQDEPYFEDGSIALHINSQVASSNIIYVTSAGNAAAPGGDFGSRHHYQGLYYKSGTTNWADLSRGTAPATPSLYLNLSTGRTVSIFLQWDDQWGESGNDYDLYLHTIDGSILAVSQTTQSGTGDPFEYLSYTTTGPTMDVKINVLNYNGLAQTKNLEIFILTDGYTWVYNNNIIPADSIYGHHAASDAVTVAAVPASSPSTIEPYSSRGPVAIAYPSSQNRQKPDITGTDCVSVTGVGGFGSPFCGTSAAAPHIAAIVAQYWGSRPTLTAAQVRNALYTYIGIDLGTSGKDTIYGYGRADALAMAIGSGPNPGNNAVVTKTFHFGKSGDTPVISNWNGDGTTDAGVFRPSVGNWYFDTTKTGVVYNTFHFGKSGDIPVTGDWNGDGITDIGVFRPSTGYWHLDSNRDGIVDIDLKFGKIGDIPVTGDWNGDSKSDIGVFRPSTGFWYMNYSTLT